MYTNQPFDEAYGSFYVSWKVGRGYVLESKVRVELAQFNEKPTMRVNCDDSVRVQLHGDGVIYTTNSELYVPTQEGLFHDELVLSEDGSTLSFLTGIRDQVRPWAEWHRDTGEVRSQLLDAISSLSWDGLTAFGISQCYTQPCSFPKTFRWRPLEGVEDVTTTAPAALVAADGESIVYDYKETHIGIWRNGETQVVDCVDACSAVAWSSRAQVLLVSRDGDFAIWTAPHGFRRLSTLIDIPDDWGVVPTGLSLDGWTVTGDAFKAGVPRAYFRASLVEGAFR